MPIQFSFGQSPAGVTMTGALEGEDVQVSTRAYLSTEDGNLFVSHLEAVWGYFCGAMNSSGIQPSQVDHFLAVIDRDGTATLFVNELQQRALVRAKRAIDAGEHIFRDDIAGIEELQFLDSAGTPVNIPPDNGLVLILSVGWRKCLYYDFEALLPETSNRSVNLPRLFARFHQQLLFQKLYSITDEQWNAMFAWGWFPFIWMSQEEREKIVLFSSRIDEPRSVFEEVCDKFKSQLEDRSMSWQKFVIFQDHAQFIEKAVEHHLKGDYLSSIQVLFPRIEGIMRQLYLLQSPGSKPQQRTMVEAVVKSHDDYSPLLPTRFKEYLINFYFRTFDEATSNLPLSRNTVGHGNSLPADYDLVKSSLGFMICDQLFYFLAPLENSK